MYSNYYYFFKAQQSKEFEILVRNIQYYWQLLDYSVNTSDELEVTLHQLFEQFPLEPISITSAPVTFHIKDVYYYQHTNLPLSKNIISKLNEKKLELSGLLPAKVDEDFSLNYGDVTPEFAQALVDKLMS